MPAATTTSCRRPESSFDQILESANTGLEVVAGTRLVAGRVRVDARGRLLVLLSASGHRERAWG